MDSAHRNTEPTLLQRQRLAETGYGKLGGRIRRAGGLRPLPIRQAQLIIRHTGGVMTFEFDVDGFLTELNLPPLIGRQEAN